jgi:hypothetical protein
MSRAKLVVNTDYIASSISNNVKFIFCGLVLVIYFGWMDIALFLHVQRWNIPPLRIEEPSLLNRIFNKTNAEGYDVNKDSYQNEVLSTFKPLSIKLIMLDHGSHYIHDIIARFIENTFQFTATFPWVTPDLVSFSGLFAALIACKFVLSDKRSYNRIGAILFEVRNLADAMDGVVYRSRKHINILNRSSSSTHGFQIDAICDTLGGFAILIAIFIRILRHRPHKGKLIFFYFSKKLFSPNPQLFHGLLAF